MCIIKTDISTKQPRNPLPWLFNHIIFLNVTTVSELFIIVIAEVITKQLFNSY